MVTPRRFELDELLNRPGTYFNPETEVLIVVDDAATLDTEIVESDHDEADWVMISDETPLDENQRDELLEAFAVQYGGGPDALPEEDEPDEEEHLEPDEDEDE